MTEEKTIFDGGVIHSARAVEELFGPEQAQQSIEDWMEELQSMDWRSQETVRDWRGLTIAATVRPASRKNADHV